MNENITYVYDGVEVKKTGREAFKEAGIKAKQIITVFEITPIDTINTWRKWVRDQELFQIKT